MAMEILKEKDGKKSLFKLMTFVSFVVVTICFINDAAKGRAGWELYSVYAGSTFAARQFGKFIEMKYPTTK